MNVNYKKSITRNLTLTGLILAGILAISSSSHAEQVTHSYDNLNRLIKSDYGNGNVIDYAYDAAGNRTSQKVTTTAAVPNKPPIANAGSDQTLRLGSLVTLNGTGSSDPDNGPSPLSFSWKQTGGGSAVTLNDATKSSATFTATKVGQYTFTLTVNDGAANATDDVIVTVLYNFSGFLQPVGNPPIFNKVNSGSAVPVKFSLKGNQGKAIFAANSPTSKVVSCNNPAASGAIVTAVSNGLNYDSSNDTYNYIWKTDKTWAGSCRQLNVQLIDGTSHTALFNFKK